MGHHLDALTGAGYTATLSVEGRPCAARPLRGSCLGTASGLCVHVDSRAALHGAATSLPGRILVLSGGALTPGVLDALPVGSTFAGIVVLTGERAVLQQIGSPLLDIPSVTVSRPVDQDLVRRAVRVSVTVQDGPIVVPALPSPRPVVRRRLPVGNGGSRTPGTIDLRR